MKLILKSTLFIFIFSNTLIAQEDTSISKEVENIKYFSWESYSRFNLNERPVYPEKDLSILTKGNKCLSNIEFGYTGKEINSTSQFNHFSVIRDYKLRKLQQRMDPNSNYPNHGIYLNDTECQPYPLFEVKVIDNFSIGI